MTSLSKESNPIRPPLFHAIRHDGLYQPIAFLFVTERMRADIQAEREAILSALAVNERKRQAALFARYDPGLSVKAFNTILDLFHLPHAPENGTAADAALLKAAADIGPETIAAVKPAGSRRRRSSPHPDSPAVPS